MRIIINYEIVVEAQADDVETKMGQQLVLNNVLQYTASQMSKEDIGKFIALILMLVGVILTLVGSNALINVMKL
jgi:hypothetical protein